MKGMIISVAKFPGKVRTPALITNKPLPLEASCRCFVQSLSVASTLAVACLQNGFFLGDESS